MKRRICFIGNSHLGAVYTAWKAACDYYPSLTIDCFIERSTGTKPLQIISHSVDGTRTTQVDEILVVHKDVINVGNYDAFFLFALGVSIDQLLLLYQNYRAEDHQVADAAHLVSKECFLTAAISGLMDTKAIKVVRALREHTRRPIHLISTPRRSEHMLHVPERLGYYASPIANGDDHSLESTYLEAAKAACHAAGANLIDQPEGTRAAPLLTRGEFGLADPADRQEGSSFSKGDFWHMNAHYGLLSLNQSLSSMNLQPISSADGKRYLNNFLDKHPDLKEHASAVKPRISVSAHREGNRLVATCMLGAGLGGLTGHVQYAFYLHSNGQRIDTRWYTPEETACFDLPPSALDSLWEVTAFARDNTGKKLSVRVNVEPSLTDRFG